MSVNKKVKLLSTITSRDQRIRVESPLFNTAMWQLDRGSTGIVREETASEVKVEFYNNKRFQNLYPVNVINVWVGKERIGSLMEYSF